jgi:hypothetical protein
MAKAIPLGKLIDKLNEAREAKRKHAEQEKILNAAYTELEAQILGRLGEEGMNKATGTKATASISQVVVANVEDWEKFHAFVKKTGFFHLLQRRVSDPGFRELLEQKGEAAMAKVGVVPFVKTNLNLTTLK